MQKVVSDRTEVRVRFNEADPLGIVWHGHYIRYFEDGRESFGSKYGLSYLDFYNQGYIVPIVSINCDYKRSLKYGDRLVVETVYLPCEAAKLKFDYRLYNAGSGELVAKGSSVQVFLERNNSVLQLTNPPFFEAWKKSLDLT
jgi:acyl-CoA thioester hydrolase